MGNRLDRLRGASIAALVFMLGGASAPAFADGAPCKLHAVEMPVEIVDQRAIATVRLNGSPVRLIVDTGAFFSMLTDATAQQLDLPVRSAQGMWIQGITGDVRAHMTTVKRFQLFKAEFANIDFLVGGNEPGGGAMGFLGQNVLNLSDVEYDLAHGMIRFIDPQGECRSDDFAYWAGDAAVSELHLDGSASAPLSLRTTAQINGQDVDVMMDTGARSVVSMRAARRLGITDAQLTPDGIMTGVGEGQTKAYTAPFDSFSIGGETIRHNHIDVGEIKNEEMLLGIDFFLSHRIYVSRTQRRAWFTYVGGTVFARNRVDTPEPGGSAAAPAEPGLADAAAYARRGAAHAAHGEWAAAHADLDRAVSLAPDDGAIHRQRGILRESGRDAAGAAADFDIALRIAPTDTDTRLRRARARVAAGDTDGAVADLATLDSTLPLQSDLRRAMGELYDALQRPDSALRQWSQWLDAHASDRSRPEVLAARCSARVFLGTSLGEAARDCDAALAAQPGNAQFLDARAWLHLRRGELAPARADFDGALKVDAGLAWALYGRGIVRLRTGEDAAGRADLAAARERLPGIDERAGHFGLGAGVAAPAPSATPAHAS